MNEQIAQDLVNDEIQRLRRLPYSELVCLIDEIDTMQVTGGDGKIYQLEIQAVWDGGKKAKGGDLRMIVSVDDGGWRALRPLLGNFIMRPDGTFVGE